MIYRYLVRSNNKINVEKTISHGPENTLKTNQPNWFCTLRATTRHSLGASPFQRLPILFTARIRHRTPVTHPYHHR